ncbi:MAG TPA: S8 family serine peptidase [Candidatus Limnocylindrales bacterium]|nr:S8 family serine peptidase [Candidatus Limnocylindrales bacterium]
MLTKWPKCGRTGILLMLGLLPAIAGDHYLIRTQGNGNNIAAVAGHHGLKLVQVLGGSAGNVAVVEPQGNQTAAQVLQSLQSDPQIAGAEPDITVTLPEAANSSALRHQPFNQTGVLSLLQQLLGSLGTNHSSPIQVNGWTGYTNQAAAGIINLTQAQKFATGNNVLIGFLDTGADFTHPVLAGSLVPGWDFTNNTPGGSAVATLNDLQSTTNILDDMQSTTNILDSNSELVLTQSTTNILDELQSTTNILDQSTTNILDQSTTNILDSKPADAYGHGTMVAGVIHLVAPRAKLMPLRTFTNDGGANISAIVAAIYYAIDHKVQVLNMSFSMTTASIELSKAITAANAANMIIVASAGNEGANMTVYPAGLNNVIGVGSTNDYDQRSSFSNYGPVVTLAAPGEQIITTYPQNRYAAGWGTSFSAPFVAGGAALLSELKSHLNGTTTRLALQQAAPIGQMLGAGRLDLFRACSYEADR